MNPMKLTSALIFTLLIGCSTALWAQTFDQALGDLAAGRFTAAARVFRTLAEQGNSNAQYNLGLMYSEGQGVSKDEQQAVLWWRKSADQGNAAAQFNLGTSYTNGEGVPKNNQQAFFWYQKSADQGLAEAQNNLGVIYANGHGVPKDLQTASFWFLLAGSKGNQDARKVIDLIETKLTSRQRATAQAMARDWKPTTK